MYVPQGKELTEKLDFRLLPKILLHEHLDGGVRPSTIVELAKEANYTALPTEDAAELAAWFQSGAQQGDLPKYLEGFAYTTAVMQTPEALERIAYEFMEDMKADGVIYAEVRFAPCLHINEKCSAEDVMSAVLKGMERGERDFGVQWGVIVCSLRDRTDSTKWAELAIQWRDRGVVGFDLAGGEAGFPPKDHLEAFQMVQLANFNITIHAGEAYGVESIWQALQVCGAHRLGHGTRLMDDITFKDADHYELGELSRSILDHRIPIEMCLSSNVHTGATESFETHPFETMYRLGFRVSLNTDDRLMSDTELSKELAIATQLYNLSIDDLLKLSMNAMKSSFSPYEQRVRVMNGHIKTGYQRIKAELSEFGKLTSS